MRRRKGGNFHVIAGGREDLKEGEEKIYVRESGRRRGRDI